jgi:hypothetical protein
MKIRFEVSGTSSPLPPDIQLPTAPNTGDQFEYLNSDRNTLSEVTRLRYVIGNGEPYLLVSLTEIESLRMSPTAR